MRRILISLSLCLTAALSAATAHAQFGAIAIDDDTMGFGFRVGSPTAEDAQQGAMYWCGTGSPHCHMLWTFDHACGTYSVSQNHRNWWVVHNDGSQASQVARSQADSVASCRDAGGERCAPQASMCSDDTTGYQFPNQGGVSNAVANFAASHMGERIGDGQCWALADAALAAAGAVRPGQRNFDTYVFGQEVYRDFQPGDILQFEGVRLQSPDHYGDFPHHTAIVAAANGNVLTIYEQNANNVLAVTSETIDIGTKVSGIIRAYRPIPQ